MTALTTSTSFQAPGPGGWRRLADHFPGALTAEYQRIYAETCPLGMATYMERYGVLARTLDVAFVHGHLYIAPVPLAGSREPRTAPPRALVWLVSRVHPAFRRRTRAARRALAQRPWREVTAHWYDVERDQWCQRRESGRGGRPEHPRRAGAGRAPPSLSAARHRRLRASLRAARRRPAAGRALDHPMPGVGRRPDRDDRRARRIIPRGARLDVVTVDARHGLRPRQPDVERARRPRLITDVARRDAARSQPPCGGRRPTPSSRRW